MDWWKKKAKTEKIKASRLKNVLLPGAIKAFTDRPRDDFLWMKNLSRDELLSEVQPIPNESPEAYLHQLVCFCLGVTYKEFLFLLDMGAGKTRVLIDIYRYRKKHFNIGPMLALVPAEVNTDGWLQQLAEHAPELKGKALIGSREARLDALEDGVDVFLLNYDGLQSYMTKLGKKGDGRSINYAQAHRFASLFGMLALDESHLIGNKTTLRFRMCNVLSQEIECRYATTGTPFGRDPTKLWAQFFLCDHGETLGPTLGLFRAAFMIATENYFGGMDYKSDPTKEVLLHKIIQHRSIRYNEEEFSDKPKVARQVHRLSFPVSTDDYYQKVLAEMRSSRGDLKAQENSFIRMRQVCAGFLTLKGDDDEKTQVEFYSNPKIEALEVMLDGLPDQSKIIVVHEFIRSGSMIEELLKRKKIKYGRVGHVKDPLGNVRKWMTRPECRVLILSHKSGAGAGMNWQDVCRRVCFYESPSSPITRKQIEKRISGGLRTGKHAVFIDDLVIAGSIDLAILKFHAEGKDLFDAICEGKERL